jgi:hypothetical protein
LGFEFAEAWSILVLRHVIDAIAHTNPLGDVRKNRELGLNRRVFLGRQEEQPIGLSVEFADDGIAFARLELLRHRRPPRRVR